MVFIVFRGCINGVRNLFLFHEMTVKPLKIRSLCLIAVLFLFRFCVYIFCFFSFLSALTEVNYINGVSLVTVPVISQSIIIVSLIMLMSSGYVLIEKKYFSEGGINA